MLVQFTAVFSFPLLSLLCVVPNVVFQWLVQKPPEAEVYSYIQNLDSDNYGIFLYLLIYYIRQGFTGEKWLDMVNFTARPLEVLRVYCGHCGSSTVTWQSLCIAMP